MATKNINAEKIQGNLAITSVSATTYYNIPPSITGGTYSSGALTLDGQNSSIIITGFTNVDYIDFNTGSTISNKSGRLFYDNISESLVYNSSVNPNVNIKLGQQLYTRVINNTGSLIPKGSAVTIQNASNTIPEINLAIANASSSNNQVAGLTSEDIPNGSNGLILNQGLLSGVTISYPIGSILYLSDATPGGLISSTSSLDYNSRSNQIGYTVETGTTTGIIYVSIINEDVNLSLTNIQRNILEGNVISTGAFSYTGLTQISSTQFSVAPVLGWVVNNTYEFATEPNVILVDYSGVTSTTTPYLNSDEQTYVLVTSASTLTLQTTFPTPQERRQNIFLGKILHPNKVEIQNVNNTVDFDVSPMSALRDLWTPLKLINEGVVISANGANLSINSSSGSLWGNGIGWVTNQLDPNQVVITSQNPVTFQYTTQLGPITGGTAPYTGNTTFIDPNNYDLNGVVTAVGGGANSSTNQRVYLFPTGLIRIQYGQQVYTNLAAAVAGSQTEQFVEYTLNNESGILIGIISVQKSVTTLNSSSNAVFNFVSKFGEVLGGTGGLSTTTLQQAYDNSSNPEIVTNSIQDGVQFRDGTNNLSSKNIIVEDFSGNQTAWITAEGGGFFKSIDFNTTATTTTQFGRVNWDSGTGTLNIGIGDSTTGLIDFQVGQEEVVRVYNEELTTLQKGEIVYVYGSQGNRPSVKRAQAQGDLYSVTTLGMVDIDISSGSEGYVTTFGIISNLNTSGLSGGTPIWLSPTTPGGYTSVKPQAPDHTVLIGYVVRVSATVGSIFINISNGWELDELHDVRISGATEGDLLIRSSYSGTPVWVNSKTLNGDYTINGELTVTGSTNVSYIDFDTTLSGTTPTEGRLFWDVNNRTLSLGMVSGVTQQIGQEQYYLVENQSGGFLNDGTVVYAIGTTGSSGKIVVDPMIANGTIPAYITLGLLTQSLNNGETGYVTSFGLVRGIDTTGSLYGETWFDGTILYVSPTISGGLTSVKPVNPNQDIIIAIVMEAAVSGSLFVRPDVYRPFKDPNRIIVAKQNGDFTTINDALNTITTSSSTNRYVIDVGPGEFIETEIDLTTKPYVSIVGSNIQTTVVLPAGPNQHLIKIGANNEISFLSLNSAPVGYAAIYCDDIGDFGQAHKVSFYDCDTNIWVKSSTQDTKFYGEYLDFNGEYNYGVRTEATNNFLAFVNIENYYNFPTGTGITIANYAAGSGATINTYVVDNVSNGVSGSTAYWLEDNAMIHASSINTEGWTYGIYVPNIGGPPMFQFNGSTFKDNQYDAYVDRVGTSGFYQGLADHLKIYNVSDDFYWSFLDTDDGEFDITRKISVTFSDGSHTDASTLIFEGSTMGLMSGGTISLVSATTINTLSGYGYLETSTDLGIIRRIDWADTTIILTPNSENYIYINENGILSSSGSIPNTFFNILIGRVVTNATDIEFIEQSPQNANHTSNRFSTFNRTALGPVYATGSIVTEGATLLTLDVTAGNYFFSENQFLPSGGNPITFTQYYRDGLGGWITSATTGVTNSYYDSNGALSGLTGYTKHTLYVVGDGVDEKYFLVLGQNEYNTLVQTENALLPTPPTYFDDAVTQIANIYVQGGNNGIIQIEDIRPVIGFKAGGVNASSLHANLLGLSSDDHIQYLLVNGGRAMSGNLDLGNNDITNVNLVDGVDVSSHATRHQFAGSDPVGSVTPSSNAIPYADVNGKLDDWVSILTGGSYTSGTLTLNRLGNSDVTITGFSTTIPGGNTNEIQYNNNGVLSGASNVEIYNDNLQLVSTTDPSAPLAGNLLIYSKDIAGRQLPKWIGPSGVDTPFQPNIMFNQVSVIGPGGGTTVGVLGCTVTNVGTISNPNITTTNLKTQTRRFVNTSAAGAGSLASTRITSLECWRGSVAGRGGFFVVSRFGIATLQSGNRMFVGLTDAATTAPTNIDPTTSTTPGKIGMAITGNTGNWVLVHNITATAPTIVPLGASYPINTTDLLEMILYAKPNDTVVTYRITNLSTGAETSGTLSSNLPATTTPLGRVIWMTNNATAAAVAFDCSRFSLETDY